MSTELADQEMRRFLADPATGVISISGRWGVGKTFGWNKALNAARAAKSLPRDKYSYVSVFGLRSIDALKAAIFQSTVNLSAPDLQPTVESFDALVETVLGLKAKAGQATRKGVNVIAKLTAMVPWIGKTADLIVPGATLLIRNQLICIDDLERAGSGLDLADILGLVSSLREERNCKIVLLLNQEGLDAQRELNFRTHLEKVVDQAVNYAPTPAEAAETALNDKDPLRTLLAEHTTKLGITNIRVIRRIRKFLGFVEEDLARRHIGVTARAVSAIALLGWAVFEPKLAPSLTYMKQRNSFSNLLAHAEPTPQEAEWNALLDAYRFIDFDDFDRIILAGVQGGGFDRSTLNRELEILQAEYDKEEVQAELRRPLDIYNGGFGDDEAAFKAAVVEAVEKYGASMHPSEAEWMLAMLRELGADADADRLILLYLDLNKNQPRSFFNLDNHHLQRTAEPALARAFVDRLATMSLEKDPKEVFLRIWRDSSWGPSDTDFLATLSKGDYVALLQGLNNGEHRDVIRMGLRFGQMVGDDPAYREIGRKMIEALKILSTKNRLNAIRLRSYIPRSKGAEALLEQGDDQPSEA